VPVSAQDTVFRHVGNGLTKTFAYGCQILQAADLKVYLNDNLITSGYEVSGIGAPTGGAITFEFPPAKLAAVRLERDVALERLTDYQQNGDFLARVVNPDFNRLWMALQQHRTALGRTLQLPKSDAADSSPLPTIAERADKLLSFDNSGDPIAVAPAEQSATALALDLSKSSGASMVRFTQAGQSKTRTVESKLREDVSVTDKVGLFANGINDDVAAFSAAAKDAISTVLEAIGTTVARAPTARVRVPAGTYRLNSTPDTGGIDIEWMLDPGASIIGMGNLPGIVRIGTVRYVRQLTYGTFDTAVAHAIIANGDADTPPSVLGLTSSGQLANYPDRDSVAQFVSNTAPPPLFTLVAPSYTANTVTCPTPVDVHKLRVGMIIDTAHATKYSSFITGWAEDGSSIAVDGWRLSGGDGTAATPPNGPTAYVSPITKPWAGNDIVVLTPDSHAWKACVREFDMVNNKENSATIFSTAYTSKQTWGVDSVSLGLYYGTAAFTARNAWYNGFVSACGSPIAIGFQSLGLESTGFLHRNGLGTAFRSTMNEITSFGVSAEGRMEIGRQDTPQVTFLDFHSSGTQNDYDARISIGGGSASAGEGSITYIAAAHQFSGPIVTGNVFAGTDNVYSLGLPSNRYTVIYAATGTINTSDARTKQQVQAIDQAVMRAWAKVEFCQFKFNDAVELKGDGARWHFGVIAQRVKEAFESEGLDPFVYGVLCFDEWGDEFKEVQTNVGERVTRTRTMQRPKTQRGLVKVDAIRMVDGVPVYVDYEEGEVPVLEYVPVVDKFGNRVMTIDQPATGTTPATYKPLLYPVPVMEDYEQEYEEEAPPVMESVQTRVAGNRYGIRYEEALALECAYLRSRLGA